MRPSVLRMVTAVAGASFVAGCAHNAVNDGLNNVESLLSRRIAQRVVWDQHSKLDQNVETALARLLREDLTPETAAQIALLNNRQLQCEFENLGIAQADLVQAGLLSNPVFSTSVRLPDGGGKTDIELSLTQNFIELLSLPLRQHVAAAQLKAVEFSVADKVVDLAARTREAFVRACAADQVAELRKARNVAADASAEMARRLYAAGNFTALQTAERSADAAEAQLEWMSAKTGATAAREALNQLLGRTESADDLKLPPLLPDPAENSFSVGALLQDALARRLDLALERQQIAASASLLKITRYTSLVSDAEAGVSSERDIDQPWKVGPSFQIPIPLFDRGQAALPRKLAELRQAQDRYRAGIVAARSEIRAAIAQLDSAKERELTLRTVVAPLRATVVEQTQLQTNAMTTGVFSLLTARQQQLRAGEELVEARRDYWQTFYELCRAVGGDLPVSDMQSRSASQPPRQRVDAAQAPSHSTTESIHEHKPDPSTRRTP